MSADKNNFYGKNGQKLLKEEVRGAVFRKITLHIEKNSHGIVRRRGDPRKQKNAAVCFLGLLRLFSISGAYPLAAAATWANLHFLSETFVTGEMMLNFRLDAVQDAILSMRGNSSAGGLYV